MKTALLLAALFLQAAVPAPDPHRFHYVRTLQVQPTPTATDAPAVCAALDGTVYAHATAGLNDLRLFSVGVELPYAITVSDTPTPSDPARILNLGLRDQTVVFDLQMPPRLYSRVDLDIDLHDFIAVARVSGSNRPGEAGTLLGTFDLFDFLSEGLARNTSFNLAESSFPYLHVEITPLGRGHAVQPVNQFAFRGAVVPPSRQAQTVYTTVATTSTLQRVLRESVATFHLPARVPVERVAFDIGDRDPRNFSRTVNIRAKADGDASAMQEVVGGNISRINMTQQGQKLQMESFSVPATVGSNAVATAYVEIGVVNGDDPPVDIRAVNLQMRERKICFNAPANPVQMYYGDPTLQAPQYDFSRLFNPATPTRLATLTPEATNPVYIPPADSRNFAERHPAVLWFALIAVISILAFVAFRSARRLQPPLPPDY